MSDRIEKVMVTGVGHHPAILEWAEKFAESSGMCISDVLDNLGRLKEIEKFNTDVIAEAFPKMLEKEPKYYPKPRSKYHK